MTGQFTAEVPSARKVLAVTVLAGLLTAVILAALFRFLPVTGLAALAVLAVSAYLLYHIFYILITNQFSASMTRTVSWETAEDALLFRGMNPEHPEAERIPYQTVRKIYLWPNRDAVGRSSPGYTVSIEMQEKHYYFRSLRLGNEETVRQSGEAVRAFVEELSRHTVTPDTNLP